jgi:hypothetical protein
MSSEHPKFSQGVELAYMLDDVKGLNQHYKRFVLTGEDSSGINSELDDIIVSLEKIGSKHHMQTSPARGRRADRVSFIRQPYLALIEDAEELFWAKLYSDRPGEAARWMRGEDAISVGERLEAGLMNVVDNLISRDVYIQGMNPHEFLQSAT